MTKINNSQVKVEHYSYCSDKARSELTINLYLRIDSNFRVGSA